MYLVYPVMLKFVIELSDVNDNAPEIRVKSLR